jgi:hypothetical protein
LIHCIYKASKGIVQGIPAFKKVKKQEKEPFDIRLSGGMS